MMKSKETMLNELRDMMNRWETLLASKDEAEIEAPQPDWELSLKDVIAHLRAWQQVSNARLEAARHGGEPRFPDWVRGPDPDEDERVDEFNKYIYEGAHALPWSRVHAAWKDGFLHLLELSEATPEQDLMDKAKYPWLNGYALYDVLDGTLGHHGEHLERFSRPSQVGSQ
jgi:hypothetical protein